MEKEMSRFKILIKAEQDYKNGKISEEEYRKILDECDYLDLVDVYEDYEEEVKEYDAD